MADAKSYFPEIKLRLPEDLKRQIEKAASAGKRSMNAEVNLRLETTFRADAGEAREALTTDPLVGLFGHTWDRAEDGRHVLVYQFHVRAALADGRHLVQMFEAMWGSPSNLALMNLAAMDVDNRHFDRITFEADEESWRDRAERHNKRESLRFDREQRKAKEAAE